MLIYNSRIIQQRLKRLCERSNKLWWKNKKFLTHKNENCCYFLIMLTQIKMQITMRGHCQMLSRGFALTSKLSGQGVDWLMKADSFKCWSNSRTWTEIITSKLNLIILLILCTKWFKYYSVRCSIILSLT